MNVVHVKREKFDVYVGRPAKPTPWHWGNPFSHKPGTQAAVRVATVEEAVQAFEDWLSDFNPYPEVEPERRRWIRDHIEELAGKVLGCWCVTPEHPDAPCHGRVLARLAQGAVDAMAAFDAPFEAPAEVDYGPYAGTRAHIDGVPFCLCIGQGLSAEEQARYEVLRRQAHGRH